MNLTSCEVMKLFRLNISACANLINYVFQGLHHFIWNFKKLFNYLLLLRSFRFAGQKLVKVPENLGLIPGCCSQLQSLLMSTLQQWWLRYLGSCQAGLSSQLLASALTQPFVEWTSGRKLCCLSLFTSKVLTCCSMIICSLCCVISFFSPHLQIWAFYPLTNCICWMFEIKCFSLFKDISLSWFSGNLFSVSIFSSSHTFSLTFLDI